MKLAAVIILVLVLLAGPVTFSACAVASPLEDYTWMLTAYSSNGQGFSPLPDTQITAVFSSKDKTVRGFAGCNSYSGEYTLKLLALSFPGPLVSTEKTCQNQTIAQQEQTYLKILQSTDSFEMDHGNLIIHSGKDRMTFRRANAMESTITKWGG